MGKQRRKKGKTNDENETTATVVIRRAFSLMHFLLGFPRCLLLIASMLSPFMIIIAALWVTVTPFIMSAFIAATMATCAVYLGFILLQFAVLMASLPLVLVEHMLIALSGFYSKCWQFLVLGPTSNLDVIGTGAVAWMLSLHTVRMSILTFFWVHDGYKYVIFNVFRAVQTPLRVLLDHLLYVVTLGTRSLNSCTPSAEFRVTLHDILSTHREFYTDMTCHIWPRVKAIGPDFTIFEALAFRVSVLRLCYLKRFHGIDIKLQPTGDHLPALKFISILRNPTVRATSMMMAGGAYAWTFGAVNAAQALTFGQAR